MSTVYRFIVWLIATFVFITLAYILFFMQAFEPFLQSFVDANLAHSGVSHDVTAVLLNFRALDTLLEVAVIFLALVAINVLRPHFRYKPHVYTSTVADVYVVILTPILIVSAFYILSAGAYTSGGAFVAAALLAGGLILLKLTRSHYFTDIKERNLRLIYSFGLFVFICIGIVGIFAGSFLEYPKGSAYFFIVAIETALTLSLATILAAFFIGAIQRFK